jgi:trigger factor
VFSKYVEKHAIKVDQERVDAFIEKLATAYEDPTELRQWYQVGQEHRGDIEAVVLEEMVAEKVAETAKLVKKNMTYAEVMYPKEQEK